MRKELTNKIHKLVAQEKYEVAINLILNQSEEAILEILELIQPNIQAKDYEGNFNAREFSYLLSALLDDKALEDLKIVKYKIYELQFLYGKSHNAVYATLRKLSAISDSNFEILIELIKKRILRSTSNFHPQIFHSQLLETLGLTKRPEAIPILLKELNISYDEFRPQANNGHKSPSEIISSLKALSNFSDKEIIDKLTILQNEPNSYIKSTFINCIYKIDQKKSLKIIRKFLKDTNSEIQIQAIKLITEAKDEESSPILISILHENKPVNVKIYAVKALGILKQNDATDELINMISISVSELKGMIAWSLGEIGNRTALEKLEKLKNESEVLVVWAAEEAISKIIMPKK